MLIKIHQSATAWIRLLTPILGLSLSMPVAAQLLEEITVTAQKREEKLTDVPIAVSVLNSAQIQNTYANNIEGLQALVPSVSFRKGNTTRNSALTVRGIGTISFSIAAEPSVSTVVDGVVLGRSGQAFADLYDLERLEVLRGPQGTLFGKNASAGVVNITTKRPTDEFKLNLEQSVFEDNEYLTKISMSGPLSDTTGGSLTLLHKQFDGYIDNVYNNTTVNGYNRQGIRGLLAHDAGDGLEFLFIGEHYRADDDCCADLEGLPSNRNPNSVAAPNSNGIVDGVADIDLEQRRVDHDFETVTEDETTGLSVQVDKFFSEYQFTSITAWRAWDNTEFREGDFTSIGGDSDMPVFGVPFQLHDIGPQEWRQFSQELRVASPQGERLEWQAGLFYWNIESERNFTRFASCQNNGGQNAAILTANPSLTCNANDIVDATAYMSSEFKNIAAFGQGSYNVLDDLSLTLGLRYTRDDIEFKHRRINNDPYGRQGVGVRPEAPNSQFSEASGGYNSNFSGSTDNNDFSVKTGLQWDVYDYGMVYFTYAQGYKGPGFNVFYNMGTNDTLPIDEETSDTYEIGLKYVRANLIANLALFRTEIDGFQANNFDNSTGVTITRLTNAGSVNSQGVELDLIWNPIANLTLAGGAAFVNAEIDQFNCPIDPTTGLPPTNCATRAGADVPFAPDLKFTMNGEYLIPFKGMNLVLNGSYTYTDEQYATLPGNNGQFAPASLLPDYHIFNVGLGLSLQEDKYRITFIGRNLGDESYATTYSGDNFRYQIPREAERYFGVNIRASLE